MNQRHLLDSIQQLTHAYKAGMRRLIQAEGIELSITHIRAMKGIAHMPQCTAQALAQRMQRDKAQITRALNDLLEQGLISKLGNPQDRRSHWLALSPAGEALMQRLLELETRAAHRMSEGLSDEQVASFIRLAQHMGHNLND